MQQLLDTLHNWCKRWRVLVNTDKSKVVHFRRGRRQRTEFVFKVGDNVLELTEKYKYLGVIFSEKGDFNLNATNLAKGGGRALGSIITKLRNLKEFGINTYEKLYNSCVCLYLTSRPFGVSKLIMTSILFRIGVLDTF